MNNINDFNDYISMMVADYEGEADYSDYNDYAHECADGSEYIIYYHRAWDLVELVKRYDSNLFYAGEEWAMDTFDPKHSSLDNLITSVAYGIIYTALVDALHKQEQEVIA